jgi:hypothetical protein
MTSILRSIVRTVCCVALPLTLLMATPARADTDYTDHWHGGSTQGGWGVALTQGQNLIYVEIFHYDINHNPVWFGGTVYKLSDGHYSGALFTVSGDYYGHMPYDPTLFHSAPVGTMDFNATDASHALLSYSVNGVTVLTQIERLTLDSISLTGNYVGSVIQSLASDCGGDAVTDYIPAQIIVSQTGNPGTVTVELRDTVSPFDTICTMTGAATQLGKVLDIATADKTCNGSAGTPLHLYDLRRTANNGIEGRWKSVTGSSCSIDARFVGITQ